MTPDYYHWTIDDFFSTAKNWERPLFVIAHQDDELGYAGLIQRLGAGCRFIWVTNGDGLYFQDNVTPEEYGKIRMAEAIKAVGAVFVPVENTRCLAFSEVEIYRNMAELHKNPAGIESSFALWDEIRQSVRDALFEAKPDAVFTGAWQGGHPEHDLAHYFTRLAIDDYEKETGTIVPFFHLPEYEYTILIAFRFHPLYKGPKLKFDLTEKEMEGKQAIMDQYPSQQNLFKDFESVLSKVSFISGLFGGPKSAMEYLSTEHFGPVPPDLDYTRSTHFFDWANYIFDDFEGTPISFKRSILPIISALPRSPSR